MSFQLLMNQETPLAAHLAKRVEELEKQLLISKTALLDEKAQSSKTQQQLVRLMEEVRLKDAVIHDLRSAIYEEKKTTARLATQTTIPRPDSSAHMEPVLQTAPFTLPATATFNTVSSQLPVNESRVLSARTQGVPITATFKKSTLELPKSSGFPFDRTPPEDFLRVQRWARAGLEPLVFRTAIAGGLDFEETLHECEQFTMRFSGHSDARSCDFSLRLRAKHAIREVKILPEAMTAKATEFTLFLEQERVPAGLIPGDEASFVGKFLVNRPFDRRVVICVSVVVSESGRAVDTYVTLPILLGKFALPALGWSQQDVLETWIRSETNQQDALIEKTRQSVTSSQMLPGNFAKYDGLDGSGKGAVFVGKVLGETVLARVELGQDVRCENMAVVTIRSASSAFLAKCLLSNFALLIAAPATQPESHQK